MLNKAEGQKVSWTKIDFKQTDLYIAATEKGLCYVGSPGQPFEEFETNLRRRFPLAVLVEEQEMLRPFAYEFAEYLKGAKRTFTKPVDVKGTPFQEQVWEALKTIPYGKTVSYSDIAERVNKPSAVRAVGTAIGANPVLMAIPCHRVIGKNGSITGYRGGTEMKQILLELEAGADSVGC